MKLKRFFSRWLYWLYYAWLVMRDLPLVLSRQALAFNHDEVCNPAAGRVFAIVVKYGRIGVGDDFLMLLQALRAHGVNAVVVHNGDIEDGALAALRPVCHRLLVRRNIGRDFGAYRAVTLKLAEEQLSVDRLIYLNDSVIYLRRPGLQTLISALARESRHVTAAFENHEISHHVGSYVFSVPGWLLLAPDYLAFWRAYRPFNIRPYAIHRGEVALSQMLKKLGLIFDVLYSADRLGLAMRMMKVSELVAVASLRPRRHTPEVQALALTDLSQFTDLTQALHGGGGEASGGAMAKQAGLTTLRAPVLCDEPPQVAATTFGQLVKDRLVFNILSVFMSRSQVHLGFGVYYRVMDCPFVKRDLLFQGIYDEMELARILSDLPREEANGIIRQIATRGRPVSMPFWRRFKHEHGLD